MLDFNQVALQIDSFSKAEKDRYVLHYEALQEATSRLHSSRNDWQESVEKIDSHKTSWLVARWLESPDSRIPANSRPDRFTVIASDGSQIVADRHEVALCYLINVGSIILRYGTGERPKLYSTPNLALADEEMLDESMPEQALISTKRLGARRLLAEIAALSELTEQEIRRQPDAPPMLALFDGSLILWPIEKEKEPFLSDALTEFNEALDGFRNRRVPIAGYISKPMSRDVVNSLNVYRCPHESANCDRFCPDRRNPKPHFKPPDCAGTEQVTDAELFWKLLLPGERSAVFNSGMDSKVLKLYHDDNKIYFFYLHTGLEISRIEIPSWVANDDELLSLTHSLSMDQAKKGDGYPVSLSEAHEQAIVRGAERSAFFSMMERKFVTMKLPAGGTQKSVSKRARRT